MRGRPHGNAQSTLVQKPKRGAPGSVQHSTVSVAGAEAIESDRWLAGQWRSLALLCIGAVAFLVVTWRLRKPAGIFGVDEHLYSALALRDHQGPLAQALFHSGQNAPLVPLVASVFTRVDEMPSSVVLAIVPFVCALILGTYWLTRGLAGPRASLVVAAVVGFAPGVTMWGRSLHFSVAATAALSVATAAVLASNGLSRRRFGLVVGIALGVALLSRTVSVALVPGVVVVAIIMAFHGRTGWRRSLETLALMMGGLLITAGPWYLVNIDVVWSYLSGNALGGVYTDGAGPGSVHFWWIRLGELTGSDLLAPLTLLGLGIVVASVWRTRRPIDWQIAPILLILGWYYAVLTISRNTGTAFALPMVPLVCAAAAYYAGALPALWRTRAAVAALALTMVNVVAALIPLPRVSVGPVAMLDGRSATEIQISEALGLPDGRLVDPTRTGRDMQSASCAAASRSSRGPILLTRLDALVNVESVKYCALAFYSEDASVAAANCPRDDAACVTEVVARYGWPTVVSGGWLADLPGSVNDAATKPALDEGYTRGETFVLADGVWATIWGRSDMP